MTVSSADRSRVTNTFPVDQNTLYMSFEVAQCSRPKLGEVTGIDYIMVVFHILPNEFACLSHNCTTQHSAQHDSHGQRDWRAKERLPEEKEIWF